MSSRSIWHPRYNGRRQGHALLLNIPHSRPAEYKRSSLPRNMTVNSTYVGCVLRKSCKIKRWEACVQDHQEQSQWTQMSP